MRAVHLAISDTELQERHRAGVDIWDEMWDGELHMVPPPSFDHQDITSGIGEFLRAEGRRRGMGRAVVQAGLYDPAHPDTNYKVPDVLFVATGHESVIQPRGVVGPADVVVEVKSPDDETYEKFPFFAMLGVAEVIVIHPGPRRPEVYRLAGRQYVAIASDPEGWVTSEVLRIRFRTLIDPLRLRVEPLDDPVRGIDL